MFWLYIKGVFESQLAQNKFHSSSHRHTWVLRSGAKVKNGVKQQKIGTQSWLQTPLKFCNFNTGIEPQTHADHPGARGTSGDHVFQSTIKLYMYFNLEQ